MQQAIPHGVRIYTIAKQSGKWPVSVLAGSWGLLAAYLVVPLGLGSSGWGKRPHACVAARFVLSLVFGVLPPALLYMW